ncbi:ed50dfad-0c2c-4da0-b560-a896beed96fb [Sclerotinia trifoliorum]|uniref:Ed50dfad-0c2c-4da0-b560-a896beed96fb n=1 Tax=Sclerotinia trifoliorum TaxID=28548 RepID=A0A8H2VXV3_9HELO|nr:ed50dfad-0c2c-4da0-b560-a896beed96fb [Sclerotinia trifoliorum]
MVNFQFQIPVPCQNCRRFHYGYCRDAPRQCWRCNDYNHIERYCPRRRTRWPRGQVLPGTHQWCDYHGLGSDPALRARVLNALKASPSCNIYVDDDCIYKGCIEHHFRREEVRSRPLAERMTRRRSRSPGREQIKRGRSRSPIRQRSPSPMERRSRHQRQASPVRQVLGRSKSPSRQQRQSPQRTAVRPRGRSPVFDTSGVACTQTNAAATGTNIFQPSFLQNQGFAVSQKQASATQHIQQSTIDVASLNTINLNPFLAPPTLLGTVSPNKTRQETAKDVSNHTVVTIQQPVMNPPSQIQDMDEVYVDDPHFVLGVREEALEKEILEAYQQRMWEVELERVADTDYKEAPGPDNVWDQSVAILRAAKKKLVGY